MLSRRSDPYSTNATLGAAFNGFYALPQMLTESVADLTQLDLPNALGLLGKSTTSLFSNLLSPQTPTNSEKDVVQKSPAFKDISKDEALKILKWTSPGSYLIIPEKVGQKSHYLLGYVKKKDTYEFLKLTAGPTLVSYGEDPTISSAFLTGLLIKLRQNEILLTELGNQRISIALNKLSSLAKKRFELSQTHLKEDVSSFIQSNLTSYDVEPLTQLFCQIINLMTTSPLYRGKTLCFDSTATDQVYLENPSYQVWIDKQELPYGGKCIFKFPYDFRVEMSEDGKQINLMVIPKITITKTFRDGYQLGVQANHLLGKGSYKQTFALHKLAISTFLKNNKRAQAYIPSVLYRTNNINKEGNFKDDVKTENKAILEGIKAFETLTKELTRTDPQVSMIEPPRRLIPFSKQNIPENIDSEEDVPTTPLEFTQEWINSDLSAILSTGVVPLDFSQSSPTKCLSPLDFLTVFTDAALQLSKIHEQGFVHQDVKSSNLLVKLTSVGSHELEAQKKEVKGLVSDFDFLQKIGRHDRLNQTYPYWDSVSRFLNVATPFCDCYGLAISILTFLIPKTATYSVAANGVLGFTTILNYYRSLYGSNVLEKIENFNAAINTLNEYTAISHKTFLVQKIDELQTYLKIPSFIFPTYTHQQDYCTQLIETIETFIAQPHLPPQAIEVLKRLQKELGFRRSLAAIALKTIEQDLIRTRIIFATTKTPESWSNDPKTQENEAKLNEFIADLTEVPAITSKEMYEELKKIHKMYNDDEFETHIYKLFPNSGITLDPPNLKSPPVVIPTSSKLNSTWSMCNLL